MDEKLPLTTQNSTFYTLRDSFYKITSMHLIKVARKHRPVNREPINHADTTLSA